MSDAEFQQSNPQDAMPNEEMIGSLSDYIAKHLKKRKEQAQNPNKTPSAPFSPQLMFPSGKFEPDQTGVILNNIDAHLAGNHFEKYLPTATTRLQIMQDRLEKEMQAIYDQLVHYEHLAEADDHSLKVNALKQRLTLLKTKHRAVQKKLAEINPFQAVYQQVKAVFPTGNKSPWSIFLNKNPLQQEVNALQDQLKTIQTVLETQLHSPNLSPQQIGRLVNEYDSNLKKAERLMAELKQKRHLSNRIQDSLSQWFRT